MAASKSSVQILFDEMVKQAVTSVLQPLGFRKSGLNFHRRRNEIVQVVNVQSSSGNTSDQKHFYVNVGLAFDAICQLTGEDILETPKEYECDSRGTRDRLERLVSGAPNIWTIVDHVDSQTVTHQLRSAIESVATELQHIDEIEAYRQHRWFERFRPQRENAQILYVLGDLDSAWREVQQLCQLFADRQNANLPEWWIKKLGLAKLAPRCAAQENT